MRDLAAKQQKLRWAKSEEMRQIARYQESRVQSGHVVRLNLDEIWRLEERMANLQQEQAKCERAAMYPQMPGGLASAAVAPTGAPARREWATREKHSSTQSPGGEPQMP